MSKIPKIIPAKIYQAIVCTLVISSVVLAIYWGWTDTGWYLPISTAIADEAGFYDPLFAGILTWFSVILPILVVLYGLRVFSDLPDIKSQQQKWKNQLSKSKSGQFFSYFLVSEPDLPAIEIRGLASPIARVAACLIDRLLAAIFLIALIGLILIWQGAIGSSAILALIVCSVAALLFYLFAKDGFNGQSLGKRLLKLQVVDLTSKEPIGIRKSFKRNLFLLGPSALIEMRTLLLRKDRRRHGDLWANTIVIKKP